MLRRIGRTAIAIGAVLCATIARADDIKVLTMGILKGAFTPIAAEFERQTGHKVTTSWGLSSGTSPEASPVRVRSGEALDVPIWWTRAWMTWGARAASQALVAFLTSPAAAELARHSGLEPR